MDFRIVSGLRGLPCGSGNIILLRSRWDNGSILRTYSISFLSLLLASSLSVPFAFSVFAIIRTADQHVSSPTTTQHRTNRAVGSAANVSLGTMKWLHDQRTGVFLPTSSRVVEVLPSASVAGCVGRPRSRACCSLYRMFWKGTPTTWVEDGAITYVSRP